MIRRKYVPLRIVQPGMMIDQAIIDRAGRVLIARRTRLEDFHIDALKKMGVTGIYTCEGTEDVKPADADKRQELPEPLQKKYEQVKVKDPPRYRSQRACEAAWHRECSICIRIRSHRILPMLPGVLRMTCCGLLRIMMQ